MLQSMGSQRVGQDSATEQQQYYINHYITIIDWLFGEKPPPYPVGTLLGIRETHGYQMKWCKGFQHLYLEIENICSVHQGQWEETALLWQCSHDPDDSPSFLTLL